MESKNNPSLDGKTGDSPLKQQINSFLISYFNYVILAAAIIVLAAGLYLFIYPEYQKMSESDQLAREKMQTEYEIQNSYLDRIGNLKKSYQLISEADKQKIKAMVPDNDRLTDLIPDIESIVQRNSAVLNSIKIEPKNFDVSARANEVVVESGEKREPPAGIFGGPLPAGVKLATIEISLGSVNYQVLKNIVKTLENNLRLFDVAEINYGAADSKASLVVYTYYLHL